MFRYIRVVLMNMYIYRYGRMTYGSILRGTKPPRIVMRFNPDSDKTTPPDLQMITSFTGVVEPELLQIDRVVEPV